MKMFYALCMLITVSMGMSVYGSQFPDLDVRISEYDAHVAQLHAAFAAVPADIHDKTWVR